MYKNVLQSIAGVDIYPIISLVIFVTVFAAVIIHVIRAPKAWLNHMSNLPLENSETEKV